MYERTKGYDGWMGKVDGKECEFSVVGTGRVKGDQKVHPLIIINTGERAEFKFLLDWDKKTTVRSFGCLS